MLIEVEGPSGAGKSSLIKSIQTSWRGLTPINIAEVEFKAHSGLGWTLGTFMRGLNVSPEPLEALFLYCARTAARTQLVLEHIANDRVVFADRFRLSLKVAASEAGLGPDAAEFLVGFATRSIEPDVTVLLDVQHEVHCHRLAERGHQPIPGEEFEDNRRYFRDAAASQSGRKLILDTSNLTLAEVRAAVVGRLPIAGGVT
jgi:thymidylate kinase